jgi:acyl-CoA synthetase (AMP-forming)/AMP-acid ligase II/acyl carrier protein
MKKDINMFAAVARNCEAKVALTCTVYYHAKKIVGIKEKLTFSDSLPWPELDWTITDDLLNAKIESKAILSNIEAISSKDVAFLQYTSGSTSTPKGVMLTHANLNHNLRTIISALQATRETIVVSWLPQYHDMGLIGAYLGTIFCGATGFYMSPFSFIRNPIMWIRLLSKYKATHLQAPNFAYALCARKASLLDDPKYAGSEAIDLSSIKHMINGAEPIQGTTLDLFYNTFSRYGLLSNVIKPTYGLAEHTVYVCGSGSQRVFVDKKLLEEKHAFKILSEPNGSGFKFNNAIAHDNEKTPQVKEMIGCGIASLRDHEVDVRIVDPDTCEQLPEKQVGEIWISSPSKAFGYFGQKELSNEIFHAMITNDPTNCKKEFLRTGDLGVLYNQELFICGRKKDLIIIRGRNHYPQDIESSAEMIGKEELRPGCIAAFSFGDQEEEEKEKQEEEEKLVLIAELKDPQMKNKASLCNRLRAAINKEHGVKITIIVLLSPRTIPKTTSGKIARSKCKKDFKEKQLKELYRNKDIIESNEVVEDNNYDNDDDDDDDDQNEENMKKKKTFSSDQKGNQIGKTKSAAVADLCTSITDEPPERIHEFLVAEISQLLDIEAHHVQKDTPLQALGMDSMALTQLQGVLTQKYNIHIQEEVLYNEETTLNTLFKVLCTGEKAGNTGASSIGAVDPNTSSIVSNCTNSVDPNASFLEGRHKKKKGRVFCGCISI